MGSARRDAPLASTVELSTYSLVGVWLTANRIDVDADTPEASCEYTNRRIPAFPNSSPVHYSSAICIPLWNNKHEE